MVVVGGLIISLSFRCENLTERRTRQRAQQFDAERYARDLWDNRLPQILDQSIDARQLLTLLNTDMEEAMKQGRTLGESRVHAYLMQGRGTIVAKGKKGLAVSVTEPPSRPDILIATGAFVSGNAVRDASGLVDVSTFTDTMKFNRVSFEINKIVVREVLQPFVEQRPTSGQTLHFVGAAEVAEDATEKQSFGDPIHDGSLGLVHHLLKVIPIRLTIE